MNDNLTIKDIIYVILILLIGSTIGLYIEQQNLNYLHFFIVSCLIIFLLYFYDRIKKYIQLTTLEIINNKIKSGEIKKKSD